MTTSIMEHLEECLAIRTPNEGLDYCAFNSPFNGKSLKTYVLRSIYKE